MKIHADQMMNLVRLGLKVDQSKPSPTIYTYVCMYMHMHMHIYVYVCTYDICMCVRVDVCIDMCAMIKDATDSYYDQLVPVKIRRS